MTAIAGAVALADTAWWLRVLAGAAALLGLAAIFAPIFHYWPCEDQAKKERERRQYLAELGQAGEVIRREQTTTLEEHLDRMRRGRDWISGTAAWVEAHYSTADRSIFLGVSPRVLDDSVMGELTAFEQQLEQSLANLLKLLDR